MNAERARSINQIGDTERAVGVSGMGVAIGRFPVIHSLDNTDGIDESPDIGALSRGERVVSRRTELGARGIGTAPGTKIVGAEPVGDRPDMVPVSVGGLCAGGVPVARGIGAAPGREKPKDVSMLDVGVGEAPDGTALL